MKNLKWIVIGICVVGAVLYFSGCSTLSTLSDVADKATDAEATAKKVEKVRKSFDEITEEEEYYIGRAVAAIILSKYPVYQNNSLNGYINLLGNAVAVHSNRPETYAGYHFLVLNSNEVNAMAAPGGFIFLTKGLIKKCRDEEMLASVLAHEVGHVSAKHGLKSIKKSRLIDAFKIMGQEAAERFGPQELSQLTEIFENVLGDIAESLIERGYDRKYEYEADKLSLKILGKTGYNLNGLTEFLNTLIPDKDEGAAKGWFKTHPSASDRIGRVQKEIKSTKAVSKTESGRTNRFKQYMKLLK